jgi:hypothetical protein
MLWRRTRALAVIVALTFAGAENRSWADAPAEAEREKIAARTFMDGQAAFDRGDYRRAGEAFESAYALKRHYASLWNAAQSWQRAGDDLRAANLLDQFLREAPPDAPDREAATAALVDVGRRVGRLQLHLVGATQPRIDGTLADRAMTYVAAGDHVVTAIAGGTPIRKQVSVRGGEIVSVTLSAQEEHPAAVTPRAESRGAARGWPPWTLAIAGGLVVAGGVLTVVSGLDTVDKRDAFLATKTRPRLDDAYASQERTNVLLGSTIGVAVVSAAVAVFLVDWKRVRRGGGE